MVTVIGSFTAQVGVGALLLSTDRRWSAWKLIVQTFFVATGLLLVGAIRATRADRLAPGAARLA
jgi:sirohydrochlorin ferrochelatase